MMMVLYCDVNYHSIANTFGSSNLRMSVQTILTTLNQKADQGEVESAEFNVKIFLPTTMATILIRTCQWKIPVS